MLYVQLTVSEATQWNHKELVWSFVSCSYMRRPLIHIHYGIETISSSPKWSKHCSLHCRGCCYRQTARYWILWISGRGMMLSNIISENLGIGLGAIGCIASYNYLIILIDWSQWLDMCWKEDPRGFTWCWKCWCWRHSQKVCAGVSADVWPSSPQHYTVPGCVFPPQLPTPCAADGETWWKSRWISWNSSKHPSSPEAIAAWRRS